MKSLIVLAAFVLSSSAFASHPHDRVCVGQAKLAGGSDLNLIFQWEVGRSYQTGNPNTDPHELSMEMSSCWGDYMDSDCVKSQSETATFKTPMPKTVPAKLKTTDGKVFFDGTMTLASETLTGKIDSGDGSGKTVPATIKLSCVSQPRLTLEASQKDLQ